MLNRRNKIANPRCWCLALACAIASLLSATSVFAQVRISQVYTQGGVSGSGAFDFNTAPYYADFIELYNAGGAPVDLSTWSVQWTSRNGTTWTQSVNMTGSIPANGYYLIQLTDPLSNGGPYPVTPDDARTGTTASNLISSGGKVALVNHQTLLTGGCPDFVSNGIVDFVGITGSSVADCGETAPAVLTNDPSLSLYRKCGGTIDTDNNLNDFEVAKPYPRNSTNTYSGVDVSVALTTAPIGPCFPTGAGFESVVRGTSNLLITVSRATCVGAPSTGGTVTADLSQLGGSASQMLFDDGTNGDAVASDGIYSYDYAVPANAPLGIGREILVTLVDDQTRTSTGVARILVENFTPPNDFCADATLIDSVPFIDTDINVRLTNDTDDGQPSCYSGTNLIRRGVWYVYDATDTGYAIISESGPETTSISVYTGADCNSLTSMTSAEGGCYTNSSTNNRFVPMTAGIRYWILIGEASTSSSCPTDSSKEVLTFEFDFATAPANDECSNATVLTVGDLPYSATIQNIAAQDDFVSSCAPSGLARRGVWFNFTPPTTGIITMSETGSQNAMHAVFSGLNCFSLTEEFCSTSDTNQGTLVVGGSSYWILLASDLTSTPTTATPFEYSFSFEPLMAPANDTICTAQDIGAGGNFVVDNRAASDDIEFTLCLGSGSSSTKLAVFYQYTATADGILKIEEASSQNIAITVYQGPTCGSAGFLTCTNNESMILEVTTGETYWFMIGHPSATITFPTQDLDTTFTFGLPPVNDTACGALPITLDTPILTDNSFALPDVDVSCNTSSATNVWHGVWYTYMPLTDCTAGLNEGSSQSAVMTVFTGPNCNDLTEYYCTDPDTDQYVDLYAGVQYWILVGMNSSSAPTVPSVDQEFTMSCNVPAPGDACPSATTIPSVPFSTLITDIGSLNANMPGGQCDDNFSVPGSMLYDSWHKYVATSECFSRITATPSSSFDIQMQIWEGPDCQNLSLVGCTNNLSSSTSSEVRNVHMQTGQTYWIQIGRTGTSTFGTTDVTLNIDCGPGPANDMPCDATVLTTFPFLDVVDITYASNDVWMSQIIPPFTTNFCGSTDPDESYYGIWYTYTATSNCSMIIEDVDVLDVAIGAFVGTCDNLTQIGCTGGASFETISIPLTQGEQYWFLISAFGFSQPVAPSGAVSAVFDCRMPPVNDTECNAIDLNMTGLPFFDAPDVAAATDDPPFLDSNCTSNSVPVAANGVWYTYTPPVDCTLTIDEGSGQNASIGLYEGVSCFGISEIECTSSETFSFGLTAGNTYWILMANNGPNPGMPTSEPMSIAFDCSQPTVNDEICDAIEILSTPFSNSQSIALATNDVPVSCNSSGGTEMTQKGVWYTYTPTSDCMALISETSSLNVAIAVFTGSSCDFAFESYCSATDHVGVPMFMGETYWIMFGIESTTPIVPSAALSVNFDCVPMTPPVNDLVCDATIINSLPYEEDVVISSATNDVDVSCNQESAVSVDLGVWYQYTPASNCTLIFGEPSANNAVWGIFTGPDCNSLNQVGCTISDTGTSIPLTGGTTYWILVGLDWNSNGTPPGIPGVPLNVFIDCAVAPANDTCETAEVVPGLPFLSSYNPLLATDGLPIASCDSTSATNMDKDVWFTWTAPGTCEITVDLQDTSPSFQYSQIVSVHAGPDCNNLVEVACRYNSGSTVLIPFSFVAQAGETYWFQNGVRTFGSTVGPTEFSLSGECVASCLTCPADMDGDQVIDGADIQRFTDCVIAANNGAPTATCECADIVVDTVVDGADVAAFVDLILQANPTCN
ncbi:MAG: lamin tail domain-containing protein [Phycisphaerales bacterium]|nr:lamin tail domain-containing protein [Phycisphaerales bacterium]MCB9864958.1 lamin tail domain-containing protein [Phycisphaerales bacterium]